MERKSFRRCSARSFCIRNYDNSLVCFCFVGDMLCAQRIDIISGGSLFVIVGDSCAYECRSFASVSRTFCADLGILPAFLQRITRNCRHARYFLLYNGCDSFYCACTFHSRKESRAEIQKNYAYSHLPLLRICLSRFRKIFYARRHNRQPFDFAVYTRRLAKRGLSRIAHILPERKIRPRLSSAAKCPRLRF